MPLTKLQFTPGIVRESTEYSNSGGWYDADQVRFRFGYPEKMGGWQAVVKTPMEGVCRFIHQWATLESDRYIGLGTNSHLYLLWSQSYYDLTPLRGTATTLGTDPFNTNSPVGGVFVSVHAVAHHCNVGDYVIFSGVTTAVDGYPAALFNKEFEVAQVTSPDVFVIQMPSPNTAAGVSGGGSTVTATFLIASGQADAAVGMGWGVPPWGGTAPGAGVTTGWGVPFDPSQLNPGDPTINQLRLWDLDNFGEDLCANVRGGTIYYWHRAAGLSARAVPLNQATIVGGTTFTPLEVPTVAHQILVSPNDRHLIAMGCDHPEAGVTTPDLLLVRWSDAENAYNWQTSRSTSAGDQRLSAGSYIISGMRTRQEILIWTDLGLWSMKYIGTPYIFGFDSMAEGLSIIGPNAAINAGNTVMWMDRGIFYAYTGQVQELPCSLKDYVFSNFNYLQGYKVYAGHNHAFGEVVWYYPSAPSMENDSYVTYNYVDQVWSKGSLQRTAWLDMGRASYPVASDRDYSLLYYHEFGDDADGAPLPAWIESADVDNEGGEHYLFLSRVIPDVDFRGAAPVGQQAVGLTVFGRETPGDPKRTVAQLAITPNSGLEYIRVRERQISFRIESTALGTSWRLGTLRTDMQPDGRR